MPRLPMETCCTAEAQTPPVLSTAFSVEQLTISPSRPQMGHATAPSVTQCRAEQVQQLHVTPQTAL